MPGAATFVGDFLVTARVLGAFGLSAACAWNGFASSWLWQLQALPFLSLLIFPGARVLCKTLATQVCSGVIT
uniref:Putative secreted protein n=1 Tax=Ixodes ricinus TaxID=34613 RepID=A0A6B0U2S2_IXORI